MVPFLPFPCFTCPVPLTCLALASVLKYPLSTLAVAWLNSPFQGRGVLVLAGRELPFQTQRLYSCPCGWEGLVTAVFTQG